MHEQLTVEILAFALFGILGVGAIILWGLAKQGVKTALTASKQNQLSSTGNTSAAFKENEGRNNLRKSISTIDQSPFYEQAFNECDGGAEEKHLATWAKAFAITEGDENKTKAKYIELRVTDLVAHEQKRLDEQRIETLKQEMDVQIRRWNEQQSEFVARYPIGKHFPILHKHFGHRITRVLKETDEQYAARLLRFAREYKRETGVSLE